MLVLDTRTSAKADIKGQENETSGEGGVTLSGSMTRQVGALVEMNNVVSRFRFMTRFDSGIFRAFG